jgi:RNA recognition motif-containing protein
VSDNALKTSIYVGRLDDSFTDKSLVQLFSRFGAVLEATIKRKTPEGSKKGWGCEYFIELIQN